MENARTQIITTIGPASCSDEMMEALVKEGADIFRINLSHADRNTHIENIRRAKQHGVRVMIDLPGPKIRIEKFNVELPLKLNAGDRIVFAAKESFFDEKIPSFTISSGVDFSLAEKGMRILVDDGKLEFFVLENDNQKILLECASEGVLHPRKGVAFSKDISNLPALVDEDKKALQELAGEPFDIVAASFVRNAECICELRKELQRHSSAAQVVAKIEDPSGVINAEEIIKVSDGVMVARGDLGVCTPIAALPILQKKLIALATYYRKISIVATQMLESMTDCPFPTRAEVTDVANAVLDGADAVMLSGETSVGKYPVRTVKFMAQIIYHAEEAMKTGLKTML